MADVRPFRGLRFDPGQVSDLGRVLCPPYDVMTAEDERRYRDHHPNNAVQIEMSTASVSGDDRYARAARTLRAWREQGTLVQDDAPTIYLHELTFARGDQVGRRRELIAAVGLEPWDRRLILPHERTYARPKADRLRLLEATRTNVSPILVFFRRGREAGEASQEDAVAAAWAWAEGRPPAAVGDDLTGVGHRLWLLQEAGLLERLRTFFADRPLFIADGHHRYETALHYAEQQRPTAGTQRSGPEDPTSFAMMHLIAEDDPGLVILPIHRLLKGLEGMDAVDLETRVSADFHAEYYPLLPDAPAQQIDPYVAQLASRGEADRVIGVYGPDPSIFAVITRRDRAALPSRVPANRHPSWQALDVVLADEALIRPLLEEYGLAAEDAIDYTRDPHEAFALVRSGERDMAVLLNATKVEQIANVALAGERMPEKSTYFFPKAPTGLVFRSLE